MKLYITEKASQVSVLNDALKTIMKPNEYVIEHLSGHIMGLKRPNRYVDGLTSNWIKDFEENKLPFVPKKWEKVIIKEKVNLYKKVEDAVKKCDEIILAPDPDNEGVTLAVEVLESLNVMHKIKGMISMNKLDLPSLKKEVLVINKIPWKGMYEAGKSRSYLDWIYGMNGTVAASVILGNYFKRKGQTNTLHIGGVKLPTLRMVVEIDEQFEKFKNIPFWQIKGTAEKDGKTFDVIFDYDGNNRFDKEETANKIIEELKKNMTAKVTSFNEKDCSKSPPLPLTLVDLQSIGRSKFGYDLVKTLELAQSLYDKKYQSYPRTDCPYYAEGHYLEVPDTLDMISKLDPKYNDIISKMPKPYLKRNIFDDKKVTAHTALSPTSDNPSNMSRQEENIYKTVLHRYIIQFMPDYEYLSIKGEAKTTVDNLIVKFSENIETVRGWKELEKGVDDNSNSDEDSDSDKEEKDDKKSRTIPKMNVNDEIKITSLTLHKGETKPKPRFTNRSLVISMEKIANFFDDPEIKKHLKKSGIGQPATRRNIVDELFKGGYLEYDGKGKNKKIKSTEKARELIHLLPEEMSNPILRANMESDLIEVIRGKKTTQDVVDNITKFVIEMIDKLKNVRKNNNITIQKASSPIRMTGFSCPKCKKGNLVTNEKQYKCSESKYNKSTGKSSGCDFLIFSNNKALDNDINDTILERLLDGENIESFSGNKVKLDTNEKYGLKIEWAKGNSPFDDDKNYTGIKEFSKGYKKIIDGNEVIIWKELIGATLTLEDATKLFNGEKIIVNKMKSKTGSLFSRYVILKDNKTTLDGFPPKTKK